MIIQNIKNDANAIGIVGFNFLVANQNLIKAVSIDNALPSFSTISSKKYKLSRPLFVYVKKDRLSVTPNMGDFIKELTSVGAIGKKGYLIYHGLVPLSKSELAKVQKDVASWVK